MKRSELRRLERATRARYQGADVFDELRQHAQRARPDTDPDELDTRLRLALGMSTGRRTTTADRG
jgi:hypothetical protein